MLMKSSMRRGAGILRSRIQRASLSVSASSQPADAIMILAGGQNADGSLPHWVERRLDRSLELHRDQGSRTPLVCLGGGTPHRAPILDSNGYVVHEGTSCAQYLLDRKVDPLLVYKEASSYDTIGNGYFAALIHSLPAGWKTLDIVTSDFHMPRTRAIFDLVFFLLERSGAHGGPSSHSGNGNGNGNGSPSPSSLLSTPGVSIDPSQLQHSFPLQHYRLNYHAVSDEGVFSEEVRLARIERENKSLRSFLASAASGKWNSLPAFHRWLHTEHLCYAAARQHEFGKEEHKADDLALKSY